MAYIETERSGWVSAPILESPTKPTLDNFKSTDTSVASTDYEGLPALRVTRKAGSEIMIVIPTLDFAMADKVANGRRDTLHRIRRDVPDDRQFHPPKGVPIKGFRSLEEMLPVPSTEARRAIRDRHASPLMETVCEQLRY